MDRTADQKEHILQCAYRLFKKNGFVKTTTRDIAEASNIKKGLLHYYYPRKDDMVMEVYSCVLNGVYDYIEERYEGKIQGFTYYSVINMVLLRLFTSKFFDQKHLAELAPNRSLIELKIQRLTETAYKIVHEANMSLARYTVFLAVTASVGAETEMFISILDEKLKMTFDKLAATTTKIFFTMLKVSDSQIRQINEETREIVADIDTEEVYDFIITRNRWLDVNL